MPINDPDVNRLYQKLWKRKQALKKHRGRKCKICGSKEGLTYGANVLCKSCLNKQNLAPYAKGKQWKLLQQRRRKVKLQIRRRLKLPNRSPINDEVTWTWLVKGENDVDYKLIKKEIKSPALQEVASEFCKIYADLEKAKTQEDYFNAQCRIKVCRSVLSIVAMEKYIKPGEVEPKQLPMLSARD